MVARVSNLIQIAHNDGHIKLTELTNLQLTFLQLSRALSTPKITHSKLDSGYLLRCAGTKRGNDTVADTANLLIIDGDSRIDSDGNIIAGAVNPHEVHLLLNHLKTQHFIYTSHSHNWGLNKYRVLIPTDKYARQDLPILLNWLFDRFHENGVMLANVKENSTWAQAWFKPAVHPDRAQYFKTFWNIDGKISNPLSENSEINFVPSECFWAERILVQEREKQKHSSDVNSSITTLSKTPLTNLSANPIEAFNANFSVHDVLINNGYKQQGRRYLHPNSSSGIAGVRILDNGRAYSDSNDSLNDGKAHDAFDCFRLLECGGDMKAALNWNSELTKANQRAFFEVGYA